MNGARKVLVVDAGHRTGSDLLSTELADLGFASVTASFEAADEVLTLIERPSAIILNIPATDAVAEDFPHVVARLRSCGRAIDVPVIEFDRLSSASVAAALKGAICSSGTPSAEA